MNTDAGKIWFTQEQLDDHFRNFGQKPARTEMHLSIALQALEAIAPVALDLFQVRKIGMEVVIPEEVASAFVLKHGEVGQKVIDMLRGTVTL